MISLILFTENISFSQEKNSENGISKTDVFAGKTVWIVDINSNEYYKSVLHFALVDLLPQYAPGVKVRHVLTGEKGNPFFLLKKEDIPYTAIIGLAVCDGTSKTVSNYASEAGKMGIQSMMINISEVSDQITKWNNTYRNLHGAVIEIEKIPENRDEAVQMAKKIIPELIKRIKK